MIRSNTFVKWFGLLALAGLLVMSGFILAGVYTRERNDCSAIIEQAFEDFINRPTPAPVPCTGSPTGTPVTGSPTTGSPTQTPPPPPVNISLLIDGLDTIQDINNTLDQYLVFGQGTCNKELGIYNVTSYFPALLPIYTAIAIFDNVREPRNLNDPTRTNITYFPAVPRAKPDGSGLGINIPFLVGNVINHTIFKKTDSVPRAIGFFLNISLGDTPGTDERLTILLKSIDERGPANLEHKRFEAAMTKSKVVGRYANRVKRFVVNFYDSIVINQAPILSTFKNRLIIFFLDIHLGTTTHPKFVVDYFDDFLFFVSVTDTNEQSAIRIMKAHMNNKCVREYVRTRIDIVVANTQTDTFAWNWIQAGMPVETVLIEAIHNIVAFAQYNNVVQLMVNQSLFPAATPPVLLGQTFFSVFRAATNGTGFAVNVLTSPPSFSNFSGDPEILQINVVREFVRIMLPNNLWFSNNISNNCVGCSNHTQTRHIPQLIEIRAEYDRLVAAGILNETTAPWFPANSIGFTTAQAVYAAYNPTRYADFPGRFSNAVFGGNNTVPAYDYNDTVAGLLDSVAAFYTHPLDNETLIPSGDGEMIPVYKFPTYAPFGLGARRCAAEIFNQFVILELFKALQCLTFYDDCSPSRNATFCNVNSTNYRYTPIPLAPFKAVPDSLFVANPLTPFCNYPDRRP